MANRPPAPPRPANRNPGNPAIPAVLTMAQGRQQQSEAWLQSERNWKHRVGNSWIGKRVLGQGSFGIVGHWTYNGQSPNEEALKDIVVKQGSSQSGGFHSEAEYYMAFNTSNSVHIPRMYRQIYVEQGSGTVPGAYDTGEVHRMFLEYCAGGDLSTWLRNLI